MTNGTEQSPVTTPAAAAPADPQAARLSELRAQRRALEAAREARDVEAASAKAIADEERAIADEHALAEAVASHGAENVKIRVARTAAGTVIVKRPNSLLFRKFQDSASVETLDLEKLVRPTVIYPDGPTFDRMLDDQPAILIEVANAVTFLAGVRTKENAAK